MKTCHRCASAWAEPGQPGFNNTCAKCGMPLHACANCVHFVPRGNSRCLVPGTERVLDQNATNRCKSFEFARVAAGGAPPAPTQFNDVGATPEERWRNLFRAP